MKSLEHPIGFLLVDAARLMRLRFDRILTEAGLDLTPGEARTLIYIHRFGAARQTDLARQMAIEPMTLVSFLDRLEARGLVVRAPDPGDRRAKIVRLTDIAGPVLAEVREVAQRVRASALAGMTEAEAEQFLRLLERAHGNLADCRTDSTA